MKLRLSIVSAGLLLVACVDRPEPARAASEPGALAERLLADRTADWVTTDVPGVVIHMRRGSAAEADARVISEAVSDVRRELLALLGAPQPADTTPPAHLFFVNSRDDTQRLMGRPVVGFVQPDEPTGVFVYTRGYHLKTLLRHELTHLYTFMLWGNPHAGPLLVEGIAVWAAGTCQGHTADELAAGALARGAFVPLTQLGKGFRDIREDVAMPEAGSMVGFLIRRGGLDEVRRRWQLMPAPSEHPLGPDGAKLEREWRDGLTGVRPATLDVPRVIKEGC